MPNRVKNFVDNNLQVGSHWCFAHAMSNSEQSNSNQQIPLAPNESVREFINKSLNTETKEEDSVKIKIIDNQEAVVYCSIFWPSALVFALYLLEHRSELAGKYILELGSGTALPGILAAKCGGNVTLSESVLLYHERKLNPSNVFQFTVKFFLEEMTA